jgi:hypothetical protein
MKLMEKQVIKYDHSACTEIDELALQSNKSKNNNNWAKYNQTKYKISQYLFATEEILSDSVINKLMQTEKIFMVFASDFSIAAFWLLFMSRYPPTGVDSNELISIENYRINNYGSPK